MAGILQRRFRVLIVAAASAIICWILVPGSALDRAAFTAVMRGCAKPPFIISGNGRHTSPWALRSFAAQAKPDSRLAPVIVSLGDDLEGFFQSTPPSPIDLAVIFSNFQRLGANKAASATVLAWDAPDPIGLMALDKAISRFDALVMAAPLSRGPVPEAMPPAFRSASIPVAAINADVSSLPVVNRIPLPGIILGHENTLAGFQTLDSEQTTPLIPLIARWNDRVVFAFPVLVVLQRLGLPLEGVDIHPGKHIKLSNGGPIVPIDAFGRLTVPLNPVPAFADIPAEKLIDGENDLFPSNAAPPVILTDKRSAVEPATRAFSDILPAAVSYIASDCAFTPAQAYPRLDLRRESAFISVFILVIVAVSGLPSFLRNLMFFSIAATCAILQALAAGDAGLWLPGIAVLAAILATLLFGQLSNSALGPPVKKNSRKRRFWRRLGQGLMRKQTNTPDSPTTPLAKFPQHH